MTEEPNLTLCAAANSFGEVVDAWSREDWAHMLALAQPSWRMSCPDPEARVRSFDFFTPTHIVSCVSKVLPCSDEFRKEAEARGLSMPDTTAVEMVFDGTHNLTTAEEIVRTARRLRVPVNMVREGGVWWWNPVSALRAEWMTP